MPTLARSLISLLLLLLTVAFHNIPEGLCVALPIYYSTGSRWKGFAMAALSGFSEFLGGFFGWLVLANTMTDTAFAVLFGIVSGMMVMISVGDLLPAAHIYDPKNDVMSYSFLGGMAFMSISLIILQF
jgi:zinc transporter, ZIP family